MAVFSEIRTFVKSVRAYLPISEAAACTFSGIDFNPFHLSQGTAPHCADTSIAMLVRIQAASGGKTPADLNEVTTYINSLPLGRDASGGTTIWALTMALNHFGLPYTFLPFGSLGRIDKALGRGKIVLASKGKVTLRRWPPGIDPKKTWGHVFLIVGVEGECYRLLDPALPQGSGETTTDKNEFLKQWWHAPVHPMWIIGK